MKITLISVCRNEEFIIPYFIDHYSGLVDEIIVFDNESSDSSVELLKACPKIRVIPTSTAGYFKEEILTSIRNDAYRLMGVETDWFFITDMDEFIYHPELRTYLKECEDKGVTAPLISGFDTYIASLPAFRIGHSIIDIARHGFYKKDHCKRCVLHKSVNRMNYGYGSHNAKPDDSAVPSEHSDIKLIHVSKKNTGRECDRWNNSTGKTMSYVFEGHSELNHRIFEPEEGVAYALPIHEKEFLAFTKNLPNDLSEASTDDLHRIALAYHFEHYMRAGPEAVFNFALAAAKRGNKYSQYHVGMLYRTGQGTEPDDTQALQWFLKSAEQGHTHACFQAGSMHPSDKDALMWLTKAADGGHIEAIFALFWVYHEGQYGIEKSDDRAMHWLKIGANAGCRRSAYNLAVLLRAAGDNAGAYRWAKAAAGSQYLDGFKLLDELYTEMNPFPSGSHEAEEWYTDRIAWLQDFADSPNFDIYDKRCPYREPVHPRPRKVDC